MIFGHCHLFPGGLADKADEFGLPGTAEHLYRFTRACGFEQAQAIAPFEEAAAAATSRIDGDGLAWLLAQPHVGVGADAPLLPVATINPARVDSTERLLRACRLGVRMLKFHPLILGFDPRDAACGAFLAAAERGRLPITYHTGHREGWGRTSEAVSPSACAELARRYPRLPILMAHCGTFGRPEGFAEAVAACQAHAGLYLDATGALETVGLDGWLDALRRLGAGRVIYGRDYPWCSVQMVREELALLNRLGLDDHGRELVLGGNLRRLWQEADAGAV
jgi:predicted TIM-barrel fold metal-dependent hydrolase